MQRAANALTAENLPGSIFSLTPKYHEAYGCARIRGARDSNVPLWFAFSASAPAKFCHDKHTFVATKMILVAAPANDTIQPSVQATLDQEAWGQWTENDREKGTLPKALGCFVSMKA